MAVGTKVGDLRELADDDLAAKLSEAKEELFNLRFQAATGQLESHGRLRVGPYATSPASTRSCASASSASSTSKTPAAPHERDHE